MSSQAAPCGFSLPRAWAFHIVWHTLVRTSLARTCQAHHYTWIGRIALLASFAHGLAMTSTTSMLSRGEISRTSF
eukprot:4218326-Amphidinium_carterae.1